MDRRGRGSSGDADTYGLSSEYADVAAVAATLAGEQGAPVDVVGHREHQQVICPQGATSIVWSPCRQRGTEAIVVRFAADTCQACPAKADRQPARTTSVIVITSAWCTSSSIPAPE
jgi:hypothetical protein